MAVTADASTQISGTATASCVCTLTIAVGGCLLVYVDTVQNVSVSAVVANGVAMTQLGRILHKSATCTCTLYGLTAGVAPTGAVSISAALVGAFVGTVGMFAASYLGSSTTNPFGTINTGTASAVNNAALSMSTNTGDMMSFVVVGRNVLTAQNATTLLSDNGHNARRLAHTAGSGTTFSLSISANATTQNFVFMGVNIRQQITATLPPNKMALLGVGV